MKQSIKLIDNPVAICRWAIIETIPSPFPEPQIRVWAEFRKRKDARAYKKTLDKRQNNKVYYIQRLKTKTIKRKVQVCTEH